MFLKERESPESRQLGEGPMHAPRVSVGMPTYMRPQELRSALDRIVGQTYRNLEIIVSDNASPGDEVSAVVCEFMSRDERIHYYRQEKNLGPWPNFQFVFGKATGDLFMWASDDDWRAPDFVEELVNQLTSHPEASLAFCNFIVAYQTGERASGYPDFLSNMKRFAINSTTLREVIFFLQPERAGKANLIYGLIRKKIIQDFDFETFLRKSGSYGADMLFVFWLLGRGPLALSNRNLYRATLGNTKHYGAREFQGKQKIKLVMAKLSEQAIYSFKYLVISDRRHLPALIPLWPIKIAQLTVSMMLRWIKRALAH